MTPILTIFITSLILQASQYDREINVIQEERIYRKVDGHELGNSFELISYKGRKTGSWFPCFSTGQDALSFPDGQVAINGRIMEYFFVPV